MMDEYQEILSRKLSARDQAKALLDYTKGEVLRDTQTHSRDYHFIESLGRSDSWNQGTVLPDDELNALISGLVSKLKLSSSLLIDKILSFCTQILTTACSEQGELMSYTLQEVKSTLSTLTSSLKILKSLVIALVNEKNIFASKALTMAKAVSSVYFHDLELTCLHPSVSYYTLLSDIALKNDLPIPLVLQEMFCKLGGTSQCNRFTPKDEVETAILHSEEKPFSVVTSINDMVTFIETVYTSKIMTTFLADVKATVLSMISEKKAKVEVEEKKLHNSRSKASSHTGGHVPRSRQVVLNSEAAKSSREDKIMQHIASLNFYGKVPSNLSFIREFFALASFAVLAYLSEGLRLLVYCNEDRVCLDYFLRVKTRRQAGNLLAKNLKRLWRNWSCLKIAKLVKDLSRNSVQNLWASKWGELEKRLNRIEKFLEMCSPITISQHAINHSKTLRGQQEDKYIQDIFHQRLLRMAKWENDCDDLEGLNDDFQNTFLHSCLSPTDFNGFGGGNVAIESVESLEERCNIYSIIGASYLRSSRNIVQTPPVEMEIKQPPTKRRAPTRIRAQTVNGDRRSQSPAEIPKKRSPRNSQKPIFQESPPNLLKPSNRFHRTQILESSSGVQVNPIRVRPRSVLQKSNDSFSSSEETDTKGSVHSVAHTDSHEGPREASPAFGVGVICVNGSESLKGISVSSQQSRVREIDNRHELRSIIERIRDLRQSS